MPGRLRKIAEEALRLKPLQQLIIDSYHYLYYDSSETWQKNTFLGHPILQLPSDMWIYQEVIHRQKPRFIVQTGVKEGGSIVYFAHLLDLIGAPPESLVVGIDIFLTDGAKSIKHPRVRLIEGSSVDPRTIQKVKDLVADGSALVSLDSDHSQGHVEKELELYWPFVAKGSHLVVEDTNINGHPVAPDFGPGPWEAVEQFLPRGVPFERDDALWQRQLITQHTWLRRTR